MGKPLATDEVAESPGRAPALRRRARVWGFGAGLSLVFLASTVIPAAAAPGRTLASSPATGFLRSPNAYRLSGGAAIVHLDDVLRNLTAQAQTVHLEFTASHILTYHGVDVSDGQPGRPGIRFIHGPIGTVQQPEPVADRLTGVWLAHQSRAVQLTMTVRSCGYYQIDLFQLHPVAQTRTFLSGGFIRVLGCVSGGVGAASTTVSVPSTGAGIGWVAAALIGGGFLGCGRAWMARRRARSFAI